MKAVIYCRVSSEEQVANLSLGTQEQACREHCARQGWEVDRVFIERGESAKSAERTELQAALEHCRRSRGGVDVFLVYAVDRFARQQSDHHALRGVLVRLGIVVRAATQPLEDTPEGAFVEGVLAASAQYDNDCRSRNTRRGMRAALESGRWCWQPPLGYRSAYDAAGRHVGMVPDPDIAPLVARAFRAVAFGTPVADAAVELQEAGLLGARGEKVAVSTLHRVLRNPLYKGRLVLDRWAIDRDGSHEPLIDAATWARVQRRIAPAAAERQVRAYQRGNPDFVLGGGFSRCEPCGAPLVGAWARGRSDRYPYYRCHHCGAVKSRRERVDGAFVDLLVALQPPPGLWEDFAATVLDEWRQLAGDTHARAERAEARREALAARKRRLVDAFLDRDVEPGDYRERLAELGREQSAAELELATAQADAPSVEGLLAFAGRTLARPVELWLTQAERPEIRRTLAVRICPLGVTFDGREIRTAATHSIYSALGTDVGLMSHLVPPTGAGSNRPPVDLAALVGDLVEFQGALHGAL